MKVKELIRKLETFNPESEIAIWDPPTIQSEALKQFDVSEAIVNNPWTDEDEPLILIQ